MESNKRKSKEQIPEDKNNMANDSSDNTEQENNNIEQETKTEDEITEDLRDEKFLELQARFDDLNDRYLRLFSEFDNFRKRTIKEKLELTKTASEEIILSLLPVLDDLDRALESIGDDNSQKNIREGVELILNKLKTILRQKGMEEIKALGEKFDTDLHEAISNIPAEKKADKGKVAEVVLKGYTLNGKVLRYAKVIVAS